jgi:murein DD-endopeptidase MepM/ murein hydrolase activator NlpD
VALQSLVKRNLILAVAVSVPGLFASGTSFADEHLGLPIRCVVGVTCFIQQLPDMDPAVGKSIDPFCGDMTYDGLHGTDIRILSVSQLADNVPVIASAAGKVLRVRDGMADHLVETRQDRLAIKGRDCGNGVVIDDGGGETVQYCHMKQGSVLVRPGMTVAKGQQIGSIGVSGDTEFPHVHIGVRQDNHLVDPSTGRRITDGCVAPADARPLWDADIAKYFLNLHTEILAIGLSGRPVTGNQLVREGPPPPPTSSDNLLIGWTWVANLEPGQQVTTKIVRGVGDILVSKTLDPAPQHQAIHVQNIGKKGPVTPGDYRVTTSVMKAGQAVATKSAEVVVK